MSDEGVAVYPRACGGTESVRPKTLIPMGLSPRVRGNRSQLGAIRRRDRSIPARAGEPCRWTGPPPGRWVYPRACGGTGGRGRIISSVLGLSPRVRGNRTHFMNVPTPEWSIPARAGEPDALGYGDTDGTVYPRACGGTRILKGLCAN